MAAGGIPLWPATLAERWPAAADPVSRRWAFDEHRADRGRQGRRIDHPRVAAPSRIGGGDRSEGREPCGDGAASARDGAAGGTARSVRSHRGANRRVQSTRPPAHWGRQRECGVDAGLDAGAGASGEHRPVLERAFARIAVGMDADGSRARRADDASDAAPPCAGRHRCDGGLGREDGALDDPAGARGRGHPRHARRSHPPRHPVDAAEPCRRFRRGTDRSGHVAHGFRPRWPGAWRPDFDLPGDPAAPPRLQPSLAACVDRRPVRRDPAASPARDAADAVPAGRGGTARPVG